MSTNTEEILTINFRELFRILWKEKWWILLITFIFSAVGAAYAFMAREEFVSRGKILPEIQGKAGGLSQYSGLAALAGVDLGGIGGSGTDAIRPDLYPDVISTTPFFLDLLKTKVRTRENKQMVFEEYYHKVIEKGEKADNKLVEKYPVKEEGIIVMNRLSEVRLEDLKSRISSSIDKKSGVISISSKMPDPVVAADVSLFAMEYLMEYIKTYRTEKYRQDVEFLGQQLEGSRSKYYSTQQKKATYADQFQSGSMRLQSADVQRERLESDYRMSSTVYNEILKKYEEAKFMLHKETPVFQVLEPPLTPRKRNEPKRAIVIISSFVFGTFVSILLILLKGKKIERLFLKL